jgi:hypothetical protein
MKSLSEIEAQTKKFAEANNQLASVIDEMETEINRIKKDYLKRLQPLADAVSIEKALLKVMIDESRLIFVKPKTYVFHGVKVGLQNSKGTIKVIDETKTIELIKKNMPDIAENMVKTSESLIKESLKLLSVSELVKINCHKTKSIEQVLIKSNRDEVEKFIDAMIKENTEKLTEPLENDESEREAA